MARTLAACTTASTRSTIQTRKLIQRKHCTAARSFDTHLSARIRLYTALASLINPYRCLRTRTVAERAADPKYRLVHHREYLLDELDPLAHDTKQLAGGHQRRYARLRRRPGGVRASAKIAKGGSLCMHRGSGSNLRRRSIECDVARPCLPRHALTCAGSHRASVTPVDG